MCVFALRVFYRAQCGYLPVKRAQERYQAVGLRSIPPRIRSQARTQCLQSLRYGTHSYNTGARRVQHTKQDIGPGAKQSHDSTPACSTTLFCEMATGDQRRTPTPILIPHALPVTFACRYSPIAVTRPRPALLLTFQIASSGDLASHSVRNRQYGVTCTP